MAPRERMRFETAGLFIVVVETGDGIEMEIGCRDI